MRALILMLSPPAACLLYLIGSWAMKVIGALSWWSTFGHRYGSTFQDAVVQGTANWWDAWEWHLALVSLIALCTGIVCLSLHLILPRADRLHD
ncbi:MAG TPA: hypothetical protein VHX44_06080 [Planctomycetota bacterium]|nr:hypothetical protein [Planctomycetota bacterium]